MADSKQLRSPKLGVIFQLTEVDAPSGQRAWEIHDVERNRGFRLALERKALSGLAGDDPGDTALEAAILVALERALVTPPEKLSGEMYDLELASSDFVAEGARRS